MCRACVDADQPPADPPPRILVLAAACNANPADISNCPPPPVCPACPAAQLNRLINAGNANTAIMIIAKPTNTVRASRACPTSVNAVAYTSAAVGL
jgi:hypothetical protein